MGKFCGPRAWVVLWACLFLSACATTEDVRNLDSGLRRVEVQHQDLKKEVDGLQRSVEGLKREVANLQKGSLTLREGVSEAVKKAEADLLLRVETLQAEIRTLMTGVEEYKDLLQKPAREVERLRETVATRTKALEERDRVIEERSRVNEERSRTIEERMKAYDERLNERFRVLDGRLDRMTAKQVELEKAAAAARDVAAAETREPRESRTGPASTAMGDLYRDAYETFQRGDQEGAKKKFETFLKQYPNTELSDNAQYWIAEIYYQKKDYERAVLEYEKVTAKYPEGDKVPAAMFKQALAFIELGDRANGRNILKRVMERYPHSDQADMARRRLEGLKNN
jgi:tol-pal system protein YbgF